MSILPSLAVAFALAFLTESFVEYLFGQAFEKIPAISAYKWLLMYVAAAVGVGLALYYEIDLIALIQQLSGGSGGLTPVGMILSGLGIGRGASWLHDFVSQYLEKKS
jgi:hypothetical protein